MTTKHNLTFRSGKTRDRIVDYLAKHPGATSDVLAEALGISLAASSSALNSMFNAGLVSRWRVGKCFAYILKAEGGVTLKKLPPVDPKDPEQYTLLMPVPPQPDVTELERRLAELEAFKAEAIAKHPDLTPIDYEAYRPALAAFYEASKSSFVCSVPFDDIDKETIDGLIAAAKLLPA